MNKVTERAIEYMIRPIKSYTGNGLLEQIRRVDEFQLSYFFFAKFFYFASVEKGRSNNHTRAYGFGLETPPLSNLAHCVLAGDKIK